MKDREWLLIPLDIIECAGMFSKSIYVNLDIPWQAVKTKDFIIFWHRTIFIDKICFCNYAPRSIAIDPLVPEA